MSETLLAINDIACYKEKGQPIFSHIRFSVNEGDVVVLQGKSGAGKTTLLKCLAHLNLYEGEILFRGKKPQSYGIPSYRLRVLYVPQRPSLLVGTPREFVETISQFHSRKKAYDNSAYHKATQDDPIELSRSWGVEPELWDRNWSDLSGGESQRIALAAAVGLQTADVLLLDEPTSALDAESCKKVEEYLKKDLQNEETRTKAIVWITHSEEQSQRVGTRFLRVSAGGIQEDRHDYGV